VAYSCWEDHPETLDTHDVDVETHPELRFYFAWNRSDQQSEEGYLRDASRRNFEQVATLLRTGHYSIVSIVGYASPEGAETVAGPTRSGFVGNQALSEARATATAERLRVFLHGQGLTNVAIPTPTTGGGELLGRRPRSEPSSQLKEIISDAGFHDAEELSIFLNGGEIGQRDLDPQFRGLLSDKRMTPDLQMELFGLEHNDPIRPQVTAAVSAFLATRPGTRSRPWEGIFRLFRYGAILMQGTETKSETTTTPAHSDTLEEGPCRDHGRELERTHEFGPMSPSALETQTRPRDEDAECAADEGGGSHEDCHYVPPPHQTDTLIAPDIAPERLDRP